MHRSPSEFHNMFDHADLTDPRGDGQPDKPLRKLEMSLFDASWPVLGNSPDLNVDILATPTMNQGLDPAILLYPFAQHHPWNNDLDPLTSDDNFGSSQALLAFMSLDDATSTEPVYTTLDSTVSDHDRGQAFRRWPSLQE